jgi:hypothetical protein
MLRFVRKNKRGIKIKLLSEFAKMQKMQKMPGV